MILRIILLENIERNGEIKEKESFDQSERPWKRDLEHVTLKMDKKRKREFWSRDFSSGWN